MNNLFFEGTKNWEDIFAEVDQNLLENLFKEKTDEEIHYEEATVEDKTPQIALDTVQIGDKLISRYSLELMLADNVQKGKVSHDSAIKICKSSGYETSILNHLVEMSSEKVQAMVAQLDDDTIFITEYHINSQNDLIKDITGEDECVNDLPGLPLFPTEVFPPVLKNYVEAVAESLQVPVDVPSVLAFPVVAALSMKKFKVSPKVGWTEEVCVYSGALADPGSKKSAVFNSMTKPIWAIQKKNLSTQRIKRAQYESAKKILSKKIDKLEQDLIKLTEPEAISNCTAAKLVLHEELAGLATVSEGQMIVEDITPEALATTLANNDEKVSLFSPEGGFVTGMMGRYSSDPNIDIYLKGFDGESHTVTRSTKKEYLENPCLNIGALFQPAAIKDFTDYATSRGLPQRFLLVKPKYNVGHEKLDSEPVSEEIEASFSKLLNDVQGLNGCTLTFDNAAIEEFNKFREAVQQQMRKGELFGDSHYCEWMGKLAGKLARLLALLHIAENHDNAPFPTQIGLETVKKVWPLFEYYMAHYLAIYGRQKELLTSDEKVMVNFIIKHNQDDVIEWNTIQQSNLRRRMNAAGMKSALKSLEKKNLIEIDKNNDRLYHLLVGIKDYA